MLPLEVKYSIRGMLETTLEFNYSIGGMLETTQTVNYLTGEMLGTTLNVYYSIEGILEVNYSSEGCWKPLRILITLLKGS